MNILVNFADEKYKQVRSINSWTGIHVAGMDLVKEYTPEDIDSSFKNDNVNIFKYKRGCGLWLWKPYFINKVIIKPEDAALCSLCRMQGIQIRHALPVK